MGDYNIQLDDSYKGKIVKGCPAYEDLRQSSMDNFDMTKYQGLWYWQKVHDWTQFKEIYDTTLEIKLSDDGRSYTNNLGIKGPSPKSNPLSWDKSPIANGAHYFWGGDINENDVRGLALERGFGVEFPNYIIDVKTDSNTREYKEAIQFQCIEVGGVRLYEGIDFMSRTPEMSDEELNDMHARAEKAGLYPYGASPEQMHHIERKSSSDDVHNAWQTLWEVVGVNKLLDMAAEITKESII
uniref:Uncharacterized protein n=1 Tax=Ditylum brightwellii TaxID=49249 RepID=A0A6S8T3W1_9STRA